MNQIQEKWGLAPFYLLEIFAWHKTESIYFALTSLRFFLTGNSAGDRKRPIQKEGGLNERA